MTKDKPFYPPNPKSRFWSKVDIRGPDECWEWLAFKNKGYGIYRLGEKVVASRLAWEQANRQDLGCRIACHTCDNPGCCNPGHIYAGTPKTNARDASERGRLNTGRQKGETHRSAKLQIGDVVKIREMLASKVSMDSLAVRFGVSRSSIRKIRTGETWKHVGNER